MEAIGFKQQNIIIAEDQEEYKSLPALRVDDRYNTMITCMGLSWRERIRVFFTGIIWVSEMTFGKPITPRYMSTEKEKVFAQIQDDKLYEEIVNTSKRRSSIKSCRIVAQGRSR